MKITEAMVEKGAQALRRKAWQDRRWGDIHESARERFREAARAVLEAALRRTNKR